MANYTRQRVDPTSPICSTSLPSGKRVQIVAPPACDLGRYSITIRKPSTRTFGLDELEAGGLFEQTKIARGRKIGRAHVCTPVPNAHLVSRLLLEQKNTLYTVHTFQHKKDINTKVGDQTH